MSRRNEELAFTILILSLFILPSTPALADLNTHLVTPAATMGTGN